MASAQVPASPAADARLVGSPQETRTALLYRRMRFIRRFEERLLGLFDEGLVNGTTHACIGQEADAVAIIDALEPGDHVFSNHRCHGHFLAWTGDAHGLAAEILGRPDGVCGGIGGSQHLCAPGFKSNGIQGGIVPTAAGIALANKMDRSDGLSVVFIGDGTLGEGIVYETLNIASLWELPLLVVVEDNEWAQSTRSSAALAGGIAERFGAFDIPVWEVDSTDVQEISGLAAQAVGDVRGTGTPGCLIVHTYRLCHHSRNDDNRPAEEVEERWDLDPLVVQGRRLDPGTVAAIDAEVEDALSEVFTEVMAA